MSESLLKMQKDPKFSQLRKIIPSLDIQLQTQLQLCDELEEFAEGISNQIISDECLKAAKELSNAITKAHKFDEKNLFQSLLGLSENDANFQKYRLALRADEILAKKVCKLLAKYIQDPQKDIADSISYLLPRLLEDVRRHISFKVIFIRPCIELILELTKDDNYTTHHV